MRPPLGYVIAFGRFAGIVHRADLLLTAALVAVDVVFLASGLVALALAAFAWGTL